METSPHKLSLEAYLHISLASEIWGQAHKEAQNTDSFLPPHHSPFPYMVLDKNNGHSNLWSRSSMEKEVVKQLRKQMKMPSTSARKHGSQRAWPPQPYSRDQLMANSGKRQFQDCFWPLMPLLFWTPGELSSTAELHSIRSFIPCGPWTLLTEQPPLTCAHSVTPQGGANTQVVCLAFFSAGRPKHFMITEGIQAGVNYLETWFT